ncbi:MAG: amidase family protein [Bauldia sp.]
MGTEATSEGLEAVSAAARILEASGHFVENTSPSALLDDEVLDIVGAIIAVHVAYELDRIGGLLDRTLTMTDVEPYTWFLAEKGRRVPAHIHFGHVARLHRFARDLTAWWEGYDLLLTPTLGVSTPPIGYLGPEQPVEEIAAHHRPLTGFTAPWSISGQPAASVPIHTTANGMPYGVQLVAGYGREDVLFRVCGQMERAAPWANRRPASPCISQSRYSRGYRTRGSDDPGTAARCRLVVVAAPLGRLQARDTQGDPFVAGRKRRGADL